MITEEEKRQFLKNEERLWDLAALTMAPTLRGIYGLHSDAKIAELSYNLADALMAERRKRLTQSIPEL